MSTFLARRLAFALALVFVVSSGAMLLARIAPGDAASELVGEGASVRGIARERARLGLTGSIARDYLAWLARAARLDLGHSYRYSRPVAPLVRERAANTALLALAALLLATVIGLPLGILAGSGVRGAALIRACSVAALSAPPLVLAIVLAWLAVRTGWMPAGGMTTSEAGSEGPVAWLSDVARHLVVPVLALALPVAATIERLQARSMARAMREPWVTAARARGVPPARLRLVHAGRLAVVPVAAVYGLIAGSLLGGSFAVEIVTAWPGLGRLMYEALLARDVNLVAGCAAAGALFVALGTLASDLAVAWLDPRTAEAR